VTEAGAAGHFPGEEMEASALDLVYRFLVYPSFKRLKAADALLHPWFDDNLLLPEHYPLVEKRRVTDLEGVSLGHWIQSIM
jgi:hypothetical protein